MLAGLVLRFYLVVHALPFFYQHFLERILLRQYALFFLLLFMLLEARRVFFGREIF